MTIPDFIKNLGGRGVANRAAQNVNIYGVPNLSIDGNRFSLVDIDGNRVLVPTMHVDVAIIEISEYTPRAFYADKYDPSATGKRPDCWSDDGVKPNLNGKSIQNPTCNGCQRDRFNTAIGGGKGKACREGKKIAVIAPEYSQMALMFRVPVMSLKPLMAYVAALGSKAFIDKEGFAADPPQVITRLSFASQGVIDFAYVGPVTEEIAAIEMKALANQAQLDVLVGRREGREAGGPAQAPVSSTPRPSNLSGGAQAQPTPTPQITSARGRNPTAQAPMTPRSPPFGNQSNGIVTPPATSAEVADELNQILGE
jgi:hypothetical protein